MKYCSGLDFKLEEGEVAVLDEADHFVLGTPETFDECIGPHRCICLTATVANHDLNSTELGTFKTLGFKPYSYGCDQVTTPMRLYFDEVMPKKSEPEMNLFLSQKRTSMPVLVFIEDGFIQQLHEMKFDFLEVDSCTDYKMLRGLEKRASDGLYHLLVTADEAAMRGNDYRSA